MRTALVSVMVASGCSASGSSDEIVVMAASSMIDVVESIADRAISDSPANDPLHDTLINPTYAGSSSLVAQLRDGAHADVIITASRETMDTAIANGSVGGEPHPLATNRLVVAVADGNPARVTSLWDLTDPDRLIGVCAVEVPCGSLAQRAFDSIGLTVAADTFEPNVRSLATKIRLGELDAGLVYRTDALSLGLQIVASEELSQLSTEYLIASVSADPSNTVRTFIDRIISSSAVRETLTALGFTPP